ncbi:phytoene/squalene synthase family protein [Angustibacter aerolatus]
MPDAPDQSTRASRLPRPLRVHERALDAAGITDPWLRQAYETARLVNAEHGRTYYLSALLLPADRRPHVYALYAFSRWADEFVDSLEAPDPQGLLTWGAEALDGLERGTSSDPVVAAVAHTARELGIERQLFEDFLAAMRQDIDVTDYATYDDLRAYMWGSASVIGLMMLPVLGPLTPDAREPAIALGEAFQLSNFVRDVGEDLDRGRVYLPQEDRARFGVTRADLESRVVTDRVRRLLAFEIERCRELYAVARTGVAMVRPESRPCLETAIALYGGILDEVEAADYHVLDRRVSVPNRRRAAVAGPALLRAVRARRERTRWRTA